jgi:hypothetical protein
MVEKEHGGMKTGAFCVFFLGCFLAVAPVFSQTAFSIEVVPGMRFPLGESATLFNTGAATTISGHYLPFPWLGVGAELFYTGSTLQAGDSLSLSMFGVGPSAHVGYEVFPRFELDLTAAGGYYVGLLNGLPGDSFYLSAAAGASYRIAGGISAGLSGSYSHFFGRSTGTLFSAIGINLSVSYRPEETVSAPKLRFGEPAIETLFPVFYSWYDINPIGNVSVINGEKGAIDSLEVSFFCDQYMDQPKICAAIPKLAAGESARVELKALFSDKVLGITEGTKVAGELRAHYMLGKEARQVTVPITISLYDRNASAWDDNRKASAFVTAKDPLIMRFAKTAATAVNAADLHVFSTNVRMASAIFEALKAHGVSYVVDPKSSYSDKSSQKNSVDYLQFPWQTLQYRAGDCDDLSILSSALFESIGIETAFITVPGHIFIAFDTGIIASEKGAWFSDPSTLIEKDGKVWMPVEVTLVSDGFPAAWLKGAEECAEATARGVLGFYPIRSAWETYKPVGLASPTDSMAIPSQDKMASLFSAAMKTLSERESAAIGERISRDLAKKPADPRLLNKLGINYARFGLYTKASAQFELALKKTEYPGALVNLSSLYLQLGDAKKALTYLTRLQKKEPANPYMLAGLVRVQKRLGRAKEAADALAKLKAVSPELAATLSTLPDPNSGSARAGSAEAEDLGWVE